MKDYRRLGQILLLQWRYGIMEIIKIFIISYNALCRQLKLPPTCNSYKIELRSIFVHNRDRYSLINLLYKILISKNNQRYYY